MKNPVPKLTEEAVPGFVYPVKYKQRLERPSATYNVDFFDLTFKRRSERIFAALKPGQLDALLWFSAKAIEIQVQDNGYILSHRPSASAGARHPIDILVCTNSPDASIAYYNPFEHSLGTLSIPPLALLKFLKHINDNLDMQKGVFLWLLAHPIRTSAKYNFAKSLIWRDAGALLQQIQMTAKALNLTSCPVGTLAEPFAGRLFGQDDGLVSGGGIIVGNLDL